MGIFESVWVIVALSLLVGIALGAAGYHVFSPSISRAESVRDERDAAREELANYKASVNQHFEKTSELVGDLTQSYVKVYQHLAEASEDLGERNAFTSLLEQHRPTSAITADDSAVFDVERDNDVSDEGNPHTPS